MIINGIEEFATTDNPWSPNSEISCLALAKSMEGSGIS